jgi:AcrR family transcriptional regulator
MSTNEEGVGHRPRGRPREFDRAAALRRAMEVFWQKGFDACSMGDLNDAMSINSPSLYAAFGSKETLFRESVELYVREEGGAAFRELQAHESARDALRAMFRTSVALFTGAQAPRGCMIFLSGMSVSAAHPELREFLRKLRRNVAQAIAARLAQAKAQGELDPGADTKALASLCVTVFSGLSIEALDGVKRAALNEAIEQFLATLPWRERKSPGFKPSL